MRSLVTFALIVLWFAGVTSASEPERTPRRPNVLLIVMDTVRADRLAGYGYEKRTTPNLDRLASQGILYEQAISAGAWTLPSHATLFTGLYPRDHGTTAGHWKLEARFETLAERLAAAGYETTGFSNNPWITDGTGLTRGFESFLGVWRDPLRSRGGDDGAALTNELLLEWIDSPARRGPFFAFVNLMEPHLPYAPPRSTEKDFVPEGVAEGLVAELRSWRHPRELGYVLRVPGYEVTREQFDVLGALYDAEIAYLDSRIGELVRGLEERGLLDDTLLIVTSDHGEHLGDHELMDHKMSVYDALIHVPLIVRFPRAVSPGGRVRGPVQTNDLFPTVLSLCGVEGPLPPGSFLLPFQDGPTPREHTVAEFGPPTEFLRIASNRFPGTSSARFDRSLVAVRGPRYKYIWSSDGRHELYDIVRDPGETQDLSGGHDDVRGRLHELALAFRSGRPLPPSTPGR